MSLRNKKTRLIIILKGLIKQPVSIINFFIFSFLFSLLYECFFSFLIKEFVSFEKLMRFHLQTFIVYKKGEKMEILIEIFHQKPI